MTGGNDFLGECDPEWVNVVPVGQYLDNYVFFTDPTYPETSLVVVRQKDQSGAFQDVELECMGTLGDWKPLGAPHRDSRAGDAPRSGRLASMTAS